MDDDKAKALLRAYGLPEAAFRLFKAYSAATADHLIAEAAHFDFIDKPDSLRKLAAAIETGALTGIPMCRLLKQLNSCSGKGSFELPVNSAFGRDPALVAELDRVMTVWPALDRGVFCSFMAARCRAAPGQHPVKLVAEVLPLVNTIGLLPVNILDVFKRVTKSGDKCTLNVRANNLATLVRVKLAFPGRRFTGFTRWGPGDAADNSPDTNLANHFKKHVCNASNEFPVEALWWWRALQIQVRPADVPGAPLSAAELGFFTGAGGSQAPGRLAAFIAQVVRTRPDLVDALYAAYGQAYRDYAIRLSRALSDVIVEASGEKVMISGFSGSLIIFGRYDNAADPASPLGISSCYFVEEAQRAAKLTRNKPTKLWEMK